MLEVSGHAAGPPGRSVMIWIQVRDVHADHARLAAAGVPIAREPVAEPWDREATEILRIRESWLRAKAAARAIPCTFIGKHLRFGDDDIAQIMAEGTRQPVTRGRGTRR